MDLSNLIRSQRETKTVRFPAEWFEGVISSYRSRGSGEAEIDFLEVERFLIRLMSVAGSQKKRLVVFDDGASVCIAEQIGEGEDARVKYTQVAGPGIIGKPKAVLVFLAKKKSANVSQLADGVWFDPDVKPITIQNTIHQLSTALQKINIGIDVGREPHSENYRIFF